MIILGISAQHDGGAAIIKDGEIAAALNEEMINRVILSGGVFANVKLNQRIMEIDGVQDVYIHPHLEIKWNMDRVHWGTVLFCTSLLILQSMIG